MTTFFWIIEYIASFIEIFMCCVFCGTFLVKEEFGDRKYLAFAGAALSALLITGLNKIEIFSVFNSIFVLFVIILFQLFLYKAKIGLCIVLPLIYAVILAAIDFAVSYFTALILQVDANYLLNHQNFSRVLCILMSKFLLILTVVTIRKLLRKSIIFIKKYIVIMCIYSAFLLVSLHIMVEKMMGIITLCFIASTLFATGCSKSTNHREVRVSISKEDTQEKAIWNGKTIEIDEDNNNIIYTDESGKKENLIRDVFPSKLTIQKIFIYGNECYYLSENDESNGICVRKINLKNFDNTLVYDSTDENIENYFGMIQKQKQYEEYFNDAEDTKWFFVADGYIYWKKKYYIAQVDIKSGKKKIIAEGVSDDKIIYTKGILRYVDADGNTKISGCR